MSKSTYIGLLVLGLVLAAVGVYTWSTIDMSAIQAGSALEAIQPSEGEASYADLQGNPVDLSIYAGQPLVINAWASWCPFCVNELPDLGLLASEYAGQNVTVIAINRSEPQNTVEAFLEFVGKPSDVVFLLDTDDRFYKSIGGFAMPETVFYDAEGNVVVHKRGFMALEEMRNHVESTLAADQDQ